MKRSGMPRQTSCDLSHVINLNKEPTSNEDTEPGLCRKHIVVARIYFLKIDFMSNVSIWSSLIK